LAFLAAFLENRLEEFLMRPIQDRTGREADPKQEKDIGDFLKAPAGGKA
jgi:hypothetical protein